MRENKKKEKKNKLQRRVFTTLNSKRKKEGEIVGNASKH
jgi:hypothetical protein